MLSLIIPKEIIIKIENEYILIKGPLGFFKKKKSKDLDLKFEANRLILNINDKKKKHFYLSILNQMIWGVWKGYSEKLLLNGVGYKATIAENKLVLRVGYTHDVFYTIPDDVKITLGLNEKQDRIFTVTVQGINKQRVMLVASQIRALKYPEIYKGKGILYNNEKLKLKQGKRTDV